MLSFEASQGDRPYLYKIAQRANLMATEQGEQYLINDALMDIVVAHVNACPLKLSELLDANDDEFLHDVFGIRNHLNRDTGKLEDNFLPRFSVVILDQKNTMLYC